MITLNINKTLIKVETWDEIQSRPGFIKSLDPVKHNLESIIGRYQFTNEINCGLSNCHTPHTKGYIVLTKQGYETNIGKDCGKTYFGVDFETLTKIFERDTLELENRELLYTFSNQLDLLDDRIAKLLSEEKGAYWIFKNSQPLLNFNKSCPDEIVKRISSMLKQTSPILTLPRIANEVEFEQLQTAARKTLPKPQYIDEPIADISGFQALYAENNLRKLLTIDLIENIKLFKSKKVQNLSFEELKHWAKWVGTIETTLDRAQTAVLLGRQLLTKDNLKPFLSVLTKDCDRTLYKKYLESLSNSNS